MATEKRLIYLDEAIARIKDDGILGSGYSDDERIDDVCDMLECCHTVDAVEVVHGHWCWEGKFKACSECGSYVEWDETLGANFWKFCPFCGAKMDGGK